MPKPNSPPKVQRAPNLTEQVLAALRRDITSGARKPGDPLPSEQAMAQDFGVSRTVMREALSRLRADGLIATRPGLGIFVGAGEVYTPFRLDTVDDSDTAGVLKIVELRTGIEMEAAGFAAQRCTRADLKVIRAPLQEMAQASREGDLERGVTADLRFHRAICAATGNEHFVAFYDFLSQFLRRSLLLSREQSARWKRSSESEAEHEAIYAAIAARDPEAARQAARVHVQNTAKRILSNPRPASKAAEIALGA